MGPNTLLLMENSGTLKRIQIASTTETLMGSAITTSHMIVTMEERLQAS